MRWGLQVETRPPVSPILQLLACSLLRNNFDCGEEVLTSKTKADQAGICHPCSPQ